MNNRSRIAAALLWSGTLALAWFAYAPALGGVFLLDDVPNLAGLASVVDWDSAVNFTLSGTSGPLGRPLALATFVPQAEAWGRTAEPFLTVNILIHLGNACLLFWMLCKLSRARVDDTSNGTFIALTAAALWLLMPLLASSSLMIIQRMTTLGGTFVLLGLGGYLVARHSIERRPKASLVGMSAALAIGTLLATFTKENGALLPTFVLVLEATLLRRPASVKPLRWRTWQSIFLIAPTVLIIAFVVSRIPYAQEVVLKREFTAWERLLTETRILWEYLFHAFIPQPGQFSPFHDGYPVARTIMEPITFLAFAGWLAAVTLAVAWRRHHPIFAFAVLWYLAGHLIESTVVPLDVYYEHRNYLPIIGPVYALCALIARLPSRHGNIKSAGAAAYALVSAFMLFNLTSLWGTPSVAYPYWQQRFPDSINAATAAMAHQQAIEGPEATIESLRRFVSQHPEAAYLKIHELNLSCIADPRGEHHQLVEQLDQLLEHVDFSYTSLTMLSQLTATIGKKACSGVTVDTVRQLATLLLANPRYRSNVTYNQLHHQLLAQLSQSQGNSRRAISHLREAMEHKPSTAINKMIVLTYVGEQQFDTARAYITGARERAPVNPMRRYVWFSSLDDLGQYVEEIEQRSAQSAGGSS